MEECTPCKLYVDEASGINQELRSTSIRRNVQQYILKHNSQHRQIKSHMIRMNPLFLSFPTLKILKDLLAFLAGSTTGFEISHARINTSQTAGWLSTFKSLSTGHSTFELSTWIQQWSSKVWCRVLVISSSSCAWSCTNMHKLFWCGCRNPQFELDCTKQTILI